MPQLPASTGQTVPVGASVAVSTMAGAAAAYDPILTAPAATNAPTTTAASPADASQWSSGLNVPES